MSIKTVCRRGGAIIIAVLAIAGAAAGYEINEIRIGGPMARMNQQINDLQADILPPPAYIVEPFLQATMLIRDPATLAERQRSLAELEAAYRVSIARWRSATIDPDLRTALVDRAGGEADRFWHELDTVTIPALRRGDTAAAEASYARLSARYDAHRKAIDALVVSAGVAQRTLSADSLTTLHGALALLAALAVALAGMVVGAIVYLMRRVLRPIGDTADAMRRMADGELTLQLAGGDRRDEIGTMVAAVEVFRGAAQAQVANVDKQQRVVTELAAALNELGQGNMTHRIGDTLPPDYRGLAVSFNDSMTRLSDTLARVAETATGVRTSATEVNTASDDLSKRTEQQAASLEETAAAMDEITAAVREAAASANRVNGIVQSARADTERSGEVVRRAVEAMGAIERSASEISEIISVIDGIAFQTNLLALNAGVEAARAGDAGKGFAVVASEVRALAQRSADAAKDVKDRISASTAQVGTGVALVSETGRALGSIFARIDEISGLVGEIATSAERQATGLQQVNVAVGEMDGVTQQNAAMVEQATAAARHLADEAQVLMAEVARFRLTRSGERPVERRRACEPPAAGMRDAVRLAWAC